MGIWAQQKNTEGSEKKALALTFDQREGVAVLEHPPQNKYPITIPKPRV